MRTRIIEVDRAAAEVMLRNLLTQRELSPRLRTATACFLNASQCGARAVLKEDEAAEMVAYLEKREVVRLLSEPCLVTMSGKPASFVAGGEFAVPTTAGAGGAAATSEVRAYGTMFSFVPLVLEKDRFRLQVAHRFGEIDSELEFFEEPVPSGLPVTTTAELREGQALAVAGLLDKMMENAEEGEKAQEGKLALIGKILGLRSETRKQGDLVVLVAPALAEEAGDAPDSEDAAGAGDPAGCGYYQSALGYLTTRPRRRRP